MVYHGGGTVAFADPEIEMLEQHSSELEQRQEKVVTALDIDLKTVDSVALARLIEEVRNEEAATSRAYDRSHNRHNR